MSSCLTCLRPVMGGGDHHAACARRMFGADVAPRLELRIAEIATITLASVGRSSLAGVQRKISVGIHAHRRTLRIETTGGGRFILKPQATDIPHLPENEHVSMRLASAFGLTVPPLTLVTLADGSLAYLVARFDRLPSGAKLRQEDFCQLRRLPPAAKYRGTATDCIEVIRRFSAEPRADLARLFELFVFSYWVGNGDLHQKNLSLLDEAGDGRHILSPVYDLVNSAIYPQFDSTMGLPLVEGRGWVDRDAWIDFGAACEIPARAMDRILARPAALAERAADLIDRSFLPEDARDRYAAILHRRAAVLDGEA